MASATASASAAAAPLLPRGEEEGTVVAAVVGDGGEAAPRSFREYVWQEMGMVWYIAGPAILTSLFQYSLASVTQTLVGHIGTLELAAVGTQNLVVSGIGLGVMLGMGSALETLCGQAFGAGELKMLGIYMQRSWLILLFTAALLSIPYVFATPILRLLGQSDDIAELAGKFSIWMIPELFALALNFPIQKFLQAQSKVMAMAWISAAALVMHLVLSWLCIIKLVASGVMLCLEYWIFMVLVVLAGLLKNPEVAVDATSICLNVEGWTFMIPLGLVAAVSVRVSNELGAGRPKAAKFSVLVVVMVSVVIQTTFVLIIFLTRKDFPIIFTENELVKDKVTKLVPFLCSTILLGSVQPVLSGVAIGAGWQATVAYINLGCYYFLGLVPGYLLGFKFGLGLEGIWGGVLLGVLLQTIILVVITWRTDWDKEARLAKERVAAWGGLGDISSVGNS